MLSQILQAKMVLFAENPTGRNRFSRDLEQVDPALRIVYSSGKNERERSVTEIRREWEESASMSELNDDQELYEVEIIEQPTPQIAQEQYYGQVQPSSQDHPDESKDSEDEEAEQEAPARSGTDSDVTPAMACQVFGQYVLIGRSIMITNRGQRRRFGSFSAA